MSSFQPTTKTEVHPIQNVFPQFCSEHKSGSNSISPIKRKIFRAKRRLGQNNKNSNNNNNIGNNSNNNNNNSAIVDDKFACMTDDEYIQYQKSTMQKRMKRKRKFDVFSAGSDLTLTNTLTNAQTFRIPHLFMFYVRINNNHHNQNNNHKNNHVSSWNDIQARHGINSVNNNNNKTNKGNVFDLMLSSSKAMCKQQKINNNNNNNNGNNNDDCKDISSKFCSDVLMYDVYTDTSGISHHLKEECPIISSVRITAKWVEAYEKLENADNINWRNGNKNGKIHEYQTNRVDGIILLNLGNQSSDFINLYNNNIKQYVLDHSYAGYIINNIFYLYQPHLYCKLIDDNKLNGYKQSLISDMFRFGANSTKPKNNRWKIKFSI